MNNTGKNTLLVVDDTPENIDVLCGILGADYIIKIANSGQLALKITAAQHPDLILLDVMMPGMDGPTTLGNLRRLPGLTDTPVIFMTAKVQPHEVEQYKALGALDVIAKPFDPMQISDQIRAIWARRRG